MPKTASILFEELNAQPPTEDLCKQEHDEIKLHTLRRKLVLGEESPIVQNFDGARFIARLHEKYIR